MKCYRAAQLHFLTSPDYRVLSQFFLKNSYALIIYVSTRILLRDTQKGLTIIYI